jgi:hypothetical protein
MKKETMAIVGIIVLMASMVALGASLTNRKNAVATLPTQPTPVTAYQFGYLKDKCQKGLDNYTGLTPQLKAEANRIKAGLDQASYSSDTNGFNFYQKQNEELRKSAGLIETRKATLQSCIVL